MNNAKENKSRIPHEYKENDMILVTRNKKSKHGERDKDGLYPIIQVNNNGRVRYDKEHILISSKLDNVNNTKYK